MHTMLLLNESDDRRKQQSNRVTKEQRNKESARHKETVRCGNAKTVKVERRSRQRSEAAGEDLKRSRDTYDTDSYRVAIVEYRA